LRDFANDATFRANSIVEMLDCPPSALDMQKTQYKARRGCESAGFNDAVANTNRLKTLARTDAADHPQATLRVASDDHPGRRAGQSILGK